MLISSFDKKVYEARIIYDTTRGALDAPPSLFVFCGLRSVGRGNAKDPSSLENDVTHNFWSHLLLVRTSSNVSV